MVMPGVTTRKLRVKSWDLGYSTAFRVCQAMSIAMTVVLPEPVAILSAQRSNPGFAPSLAAAN